MCKVDSRVALIEAVWIGARCSRCRKGSDLDQGGFSEGGEQWMLSYQPLLMD